MNRRKYQMRITLKSDLCVGSGYSYAGVIDSDICYDASGLPYIPAKRLKGCLREAAELIGLGEKETEELFGKGGQDAPGGVFLGNAHLENYEEMRKELLHTGKAMGKYVTPQSILEQFTTIKAQTKIEENGVAQNNSLRFIRTVNHYSPLDMEELCFVSEVSLPDLPEDHLEENLLRAAKAMRNMGMNRNRGLGSVRCQLVPCRQEKKTEIDFSPIEKEDEIYTLKYFVRNEAPLVLSSGNDFKTEKYISGRSVLGYFAGAYLAAGGSGDSEEFEKLFLKNQVIYTGLYLSESGEDSKGRKVYYPAPAYIKRLKKTKRYVNASKEIPTEEKECAKRNIDTAYACGNGNQPKKLKGKFCCMEDGKLWVKEPETEIVYHHTRKSKRQNAPDGNLLYTSEALREQQIFAGEIRGEGWAIRLLGGLLEQGSLRFGKSKSSQYGTCVLDGTPVIEKAASEEAVYPAGKKILIVLRSDTLLAGEKGWTAESWSVREQIRQKLGIQEKEEEVYTEMETGVLTGYYSKWNLKRPAVPVVKAGSTFEFCLAEELKVPDTVFTLGELTGEGFGRAEILPNYKEETLSDQQEEFRILEGAPQEEAEEKPERTGKLCRRILLKEAEERLMRKAGRARLEFANPAALGRVTLMLADSINTFPDDFEGRYRDFRHRISSIKNQELKKKAERILGQWICREEEISAASLQYIPREEALTGAGEEDRELRELRLLYSKTGSSEDEFDEEMTKLWSGYLMAALAQEKYNLKQGGGKA